MWLPKLIGILVLWAVIMSSAAILAALVSRNPWRVAGPLLLAGPGLATIALAVGFGTWILMSSL